MQQLNVKVITWALVWFGAVTFVLCVLWGLLLPQWHMPQALEAVFPGFRWLSGGSFILGLVESALYGAYTGIVYGSIYNAVARRHHAA